MRTGNLPDDLRKRRIAPGAEFCYLILKCTMDEILHVCGFAHCLSAESGQW